MKKNQIILVIVAILLLCDQPLVAQERSRSGLIKRAKKEWQAFKEAYSCARQNGLRGCNRAQKLRMVTAGVALAAVVGAFLYGGMRGWRWWQRKKEEQKKWSNLSEEDRAERIEVRDLESKYFPQGVSFEYHNLLELAIMDDKMAAIRYVLKRYPDLLNEKVNGVNTPLHYAVKEGKENIARMLINTFGARVNILNGSNKTPLDLATSASMIDLLKRYDAKYSYELPGN